MMMGVLVPGNPSIIISVGHLYHTRPNVGKQLFSGLILGTVHLPPRHLADSIFSPLKVLQQHEQIDDTS